MSELVLPPHIETQLQVKRELLHHKMIMLHRWNVTAIRTVFSYYLQTQVKK